MQYFQSGTYKIHEMTCIDRLMRHTTLAFDFSFFLLHFETGSDHEIQLNNIFMFTNHKTHTDYNNTSCAFTVIHANPYYCDQFSAKLLFYLDLSKQA